MTIAAQIDTSLATVTNWDQEHEDIAFFGMMFGKADGSDMDTAVAALSGSSDWLGVLQLKRRAEHNYYRSSTIDTAVKAALTGMAMAVAYAVPDNYAANEFGQEFSVVIHAFRWSRELNHETTKWNLQTCFNGLESIRDNETEPYYKCNVDTPAVTRSFGGRSQYGSANAGMWMLFEDDGIIVPRTYATDEWTLLNTSFWNTDHYDYSNDAAGYEFCFPVHARIFGKLWARKNRNLTDFNRIVTDMQNRYLASMWSSPMWTHGVTPYYAAVHHHDTNNQRRLRGTCDAWKVLHMYYQKLDTANQGYMRDMLLGTTAGTSAADYLLSATPTLFDSGTDRWRMQSDGALSDLATVTGCATLFLMAITPDTGSLAIPLIHDGQWLFDMNEFNTSHFLFLYDKRMIRIPVHAGKIGFHFGTTDVEYTFPRSAVYDVHFADDWNSIDRVVQHSELPGLYLDFPESYHDNWRTVIRSFSTAKVVSDVTWRKLYLTQKQDIETGWFTEQYTPKTIEGVVQADPSSHIRLAPGVYSEKRMNFYCAYPVCSGDQLVIGDHYFKVEGVTEVLQGNKLLYNLCNCAELPLYTEVS